MTKTKRILTAVALAAGASALSVSAAAANGHHSTQAPQGATSLADGVQALNGGIKDLNQLNQLMEVPNHLAPLIGPVAQVAGALQ